MEQKDIQRLVEAVTGEVMKRLGGAQEKARVLVLGKDPACPIAACLRREFTAETAPDLENAAEYDFALLPVWYLDKLRSENTSGKASARVTAGERLDFTDKRLLHERELREKCTAAVRTVRVSAHTIITSLAADYIRQRGLVVERS